MNMGAPANNQQAGRSQSQGWGPGGGVRLQTVPAERDGQRLRDVVGGGRLGSKRTCTRGYGGGRGAPGSPPLTVTLPSLDPQGVHTALPGKGAEPLRGESPARPRAAWRPGPGGHGHSGSAALCCSPLWQLQAPRTGTLMRGLGRGPTGLPARGACLCCQWSQSV